MTGLRIERHGDRYVGMVTDGLIWEVSLADTGLPLDSSPFREEVVWEAARVVVIGAGDAVLFLELATGAIRKHVRLGDDLFGHLSIQDDALYVLGYTRVFAIGADLVTRWISDPLAVDGITGGEIVDGRLQVSAEMDPPGGWVDVELDPATGVELSRSVQN